MKNLNRERLAYILPRLLIISMVTATALGIIWIGWWVAIFLSDGEIINPAFWTYLWIPFTIACVFLPESELDANRFMSVWFPRSKD